MQSINPLSPTSLDAWLKEKLNLARFDPKVQEAFEAFEIADKDMYFWKGEGKKKRSNEQ